uniref:Uncharacterized protein n=1 Tax=Panagrolaimus sp. ES5 TaxID=591445 RepID=A0AC34FI62_9BILA
MGNTESNLKKITVMNHQSQRLKIRADCDRMITNCSFSLSGKGVRVSEKHKTTMYYVVDTSDSFAYVAPGEQMDFTVEGDICYLTACLEDNTPLFINHGVPTNSFVSIKNNLPLLPSKKEDDAKRAVLVINNSNKEVRARVDWDAGVCSIDYSIAAKGYELQVNQDSEVYYQVNRQGYTTLQPNQQTIFYVNIPKPEFFKESDHTFFVTLQYINNDGEINEICKNYRRRMHKKVGNCISLNSRLYYTGPAFTVETDKNYGARFKKQRFRYLFYEQCIYAEQVRSYYMDNWEIFDDDD